MSHADQHPDEVRDERVEIYNEVDQTMSLYRNQDEADEDALELDDADSWAYSGDWSQSTSPTSGREADLDAELGLTRMHESTL